MITSYYAIKLARTKLHSRRIMLFSSTVVSSILFATLFAGIIVFTAAQNSAITFLKEANHNKYLVEVDPVIPNSVTSYSLPLSIADVHRIQALQKSYYSHLQDKYRQLGMNYDTSAEIPALLPSAFLSTSLPAEQRVTVNYQSPVIQIDRNQKLQAYINTAKNKLSDLENIGKQYSASGYYTSGPFGIADIPNMLLVQNGKEDFADTSLKAGDLTSYGYFTNAVHNGSYTFEDSQLVQRYLLPSRNESPRGIPVIISAQEAVGLFGKEKSIGSEPKDEKAASLWLKKVQDNFNGYTYQACYRNAAEMAKIQKLQQDYAEIVSNQGNPDYKKPSLIYDFPNKPCGDVLVKEDTRTAAEKQADATSVVDQQKLGTYEAPVHQLITFQIVGIVDAQPYSKYTDNIQSYLQNLLSVDNTMDSAIIPRQAYDNLPSQLRVDSLLQADSSQYSQLIFAAGLGSHILAFTDIDQAKSFMSQQTCPSSDTTCQKLFTSSPYGSNYLILDEIGKLLQKILLYALPVILGLALLISWLTTARVMSENRKEIAVYRSMGAKRIDIAFVYVTYIAIITLRMAFISLGLGAIIAYVIDRMYEPGLTNIATSSFGVAPDNIRFSLFDFSSPLIWVVLAFIFLVNIVASLQPLTRNVLRSPIDDIRSE